MDMAYVHEKITTAQSNVTTFECRGWIPTSYPGLICNTTNDDAKKVFVVVLLSFNYSLSLDFWQEQSQTSMIFVFHYLTDRAKAILTEALVSLAYFIKSNTVTSIVLLWFHICWNNWQIYSSIGLCACLPVSMSTDVKSSWATPITLWEKMR